MNEGISPEPESSCYSYKLLKLQGVAFCYHPNCPFKMIIFYGIYICYFKFFGKTIFIYFRKFTLNL
jgi:hypothetical protein